MTAGCLAFAAAAPKEDLAANRPLPIRYANPDLPAGFLEADRVIQVYPLAVAPENIRVVAAAEFFTKSGIPGR
jgi:hypothetical protein